MPTGGLPSHHCHIAVGLLTPCSLKKSWIINFCKFFVIIFKTINQKEQQQQNFEIWKSRHAKFTWDHFIKSLLKYSFSRGGQIRSTVTRYFFSTVIGNVGTFLKKYHFRYRCYFFNTFIAVLGTFVWNGIKAIQKDFKLQRSQGRI